MTNDRLSRLTALLIGAAAVCILLKNTTEHITGILTPFLAAWIASAAARPAALWISRKTGLSRKICGAAVTAVVFFAFGYLVVTLSARLASELSAFVDGLGTVGEGIGRLLGMLKEKLPFSADFFDSPVYDTAISALEEAAVSFGGKLTSFVTAMFSAIPGSVLSLVVFAAAFYYLTSDRDGVADSFRSLLPKKTADAAQSAMNSISGALFGYLRAYLLLMTVTFFELAIGLSILDAPYVFVLSLVIAIVDALPVLGAGSILGPWAVVSFVRGDTGFAVGLVVLLGGMYLVRQFLEPRFIGRFIGVHPLIALASVFVGYRLWGVFGMIAAPVILYTVKAAVSSKNEKIAEKSRDE
ncbi:MAG: sporulation integral membrane protein YtvI [Ruminococcaceae bacterium]|nr:sporulation integral membrane protein YtvI [Oscillospiraceae bacterium]